ncbi:MAG: phospholipase D-like domain-containing protein [Pseudomonadota bacterium]|nr:phospholipase D-like domain-containing protein [Pseudomonadota bacterium]
MVSGDRRNDQAYGAGYDPWPPALKPIFCDVRVGIARTQPHQADQKAAHEIEALYLAAIRAARQSIYIESQYCASLCVGEALAERLQERGGPDIVIINPQTSEGWLEEEVMGSARATLVGMLRDHDRESRFRIYHPVAADGTPIYVHAKIMAIDDWLLKIGSSNLNNRSMAARIRASIRVIVNDLLAEHLACTPAKVAGARKKAGGSLIGAIERLARSRGRTLRRLELPKLNEIEASMVETRILDPERPEPFVRKLKRLFV